MCINAVTNFGVRFCPNPGVNTRAHAGRLIALYWPQLVSPLIVSPLYPVQRCPCIIEGEPHLVFHKLQSLSRSFPDEACIHRLSKDLEPSPRHHRCTLTMQIMRKFEYSTLNMIKLQTSLSNSTVARTSTIAG